jgi:hypothetical protein
MGYPFSNDCHSYKPPAMKTIVRKNIQQFNLENVYLLTQHSYCTAFHVCAPREHPILNCTLTITVYQESNPNYYIQAMQKFNPADYTFSLKKLN